MSTSNTESSTEIDLESEFESGPDSETTSGSEDDSTSLADKIDTATTVVWVAFLALVVAVALIPAVALWFGAVPFAPPPVGPYFGFVGLTLVGTVAIIVMAIYGG